LPISCTDFTSAENPQLVVPTSAAQAARETAIDCFMTEPFDVEQGEHQYSAISPRGLGQKRILFGRPPPTRNLP
jgi:hypothetical protein